MTKFLEPNGSGRRGDRSHFLIREIAQQSAAAVTGRRLQRNSSGLAADELRGYVRARAARPVRLLVEQLAADGRLRQADLDRLSARALERTVHAVVRELTSRPIVLAGSVVPPIRAAA
jgi:hypothetical protein